MFSVMELDTKIITLKGDNTNSQWVPLTLYVVPNSEGIVRAISGQDRN